MKQYAVVTGAGRGLGRQFAITLARRGFNTILVSLPGENLSEVAAEATSASTSSVFYETDLTIKKNIIELADEINSRFSVSILINNAGCGGTKSFSTCDPDYIDNIIQLNIRSVALLTRALLPNLLKQDRSWILNVSSISAFGPMGYKTVYPASKRFIRHFSIGLKYELAGTSVSVAVVYPGPVITNEDVRMRIMKQGLFGRLSAMTPEKVAGITVAKLLKGRTFILPGILNKLNWMMMSVIPGPLYLPWLTSVIKRELDS